MNSVLARLSTLLWLSIAPIAIAADYTIEVEPSFPPEQVQEVYRPLSDYLGKATGHTFTIRSPRNYHFYWRDIRRNEKADFAFADAHFTEFRMKRFGFTPLARKIEPTTYVLLVDPQYADKGLNGLVGRRIATMASPSMGFALLAELFTNPVSQPEFRSEAVSWLHGIEMVFAGDAEAAMVPEHIARQYPNLVEMTRSRELPGTTMSSSPDVPDDVKYAVRQALLSMQQDETAYDVLVEIGASGFEPATDVDYQGAEKTLAGFFGYHPVK